MLLQWHGDSLDQLIAIHLTADRLDHLTAIPVYCTIATYIPAISSS
jgi:hypothetical protein